jgi:hypothetical protein
MSLIALASAKGSPGVTTAALALALVWPRRVLLAECDPAGGEILAGYLQAQIPPTGGLLGAAMALRRAQPGGYLVEHAVGLDEAGDRLLLAGLRDPAQAATVTPLWPLLAEAFIGLHAQDPPTDVLADCGRLSSAGELGGLLARADVVALVLRPTLPAVAAVQPRIAALHRRLTEDTGTIDQLGLLLIGDAPYSAGEVAAALGVPVLAVLADDPRAARVLAGESGADRGFAWSALVRSARSASERLHVRIDARRAALAGPARPTPTRDGAEATR